MRRVLDGSLAPTTSGREQAEGSLSVVQMDAAPVSTLRQWPQVDHGRMPRRLWHESRRGVVLHQYYIKKLSKGPHINGMFAVIKR